MQAPTTEIIFSGKPDENPTDFLRSFVRSTRETDDAGKLAIFPSYLKAASDADEWYAELPEEAKTSWQTLQEAFDTRFPPPKRIKKTHADYEAELTTKLLKEEELGKKVTKAGVDKWAHIVWAEEILQTAKQAGIAEGTLLIGIVRKALPDLLKEKLGTKFESWTAFATAVKEVDIDAVVEASERRKKKDAEIQAVQDTLKRWSRGSCIHRVRVRLLIDPTHVHRFFSLYYHVHLTTGSSLSSSGTSAYSSGSSIAR